MLPIVEGCRALFLGGKNILSGVEPACEVTVVRKSRVPPDEYEPCINCGESMENTGWYCEGLPNGWEVSCECLLLRIDGGEFVEEEEEAEA